MTVTSRPARGPGPHGQARVVRARDRRDDRQPEPEPAVPRPLAAQLPERPLQWCELCVFLTAALLLAGACAWRVRRIG